MASNRRGRRRRLTLQRRWMSDVMAAARATPTVTAERTLRVKAAFAARRALADPPSWTALILKAYAIAATRRPELRWIYLSFPWPHIYENPCSVATVVSERLWQGESAVFFDQIMAPEDRPIMAIERTLDGLRRAPIESIGGYRRLIRYSRLPRIVRRLVWWIGLRASARMHARQFGTYAIDPLGVPRARVVDMASPLSMTLVLMALEPPASIRVSATWDHRLMDAMTIVRMLGEIEAILNNELAGEMQRLVADAPAG